MNWLWLLPFVAFLVAALIVGRAARLRPRPVVPPPGMPQERQQEHLSRALADSDRQAFTSAWNRCESWFAGNPTSAIADAERLAGQLLAARGYPVSELDRSRWPVLEGSVAAHHARVIEHYCAAHAIARAHERGDAAPEDLLRAMAHFQSLFTELLEEASQWPEAGRRSGHATSGGG